MPNHKDSGPDDEAGEVERQEPSHLSDDLAAFLEKIGSIRFDQRGHEQPDLPQIFGGDFSGHSDLLPIRNLHTFFRDLVANRLDADGHLDATIVEPAARADLVTLCIEAIDLLRDSEGETLLPVPFGVRCFSGRQITAHDVVERFGLQHLIGPVKNPREESIEVEHTLGVMIAPEEPF